MKIISSTIFVLIVILSPLTFVSAQTESATAELLAVIEDLKQQIMQLKEQVDSLQSELKEAKEEIKFLRTLTRGVSGEDVTALQEFLKQFPDVYPEGLVTGYFGPLTEKAVQKFQMKNDIVDSGNPSTTGFGQVGPQTREKLNELVTNGAGGSGKTPPGLLTAPGIQDKIATTAATTTTKQGPPSVTPSGTIPATPAIPATPSGGGGGGGGGAVPATPATPAQPAQPEPTPTEDTADLCSDGLDNDEDGYVDLDDPDCATFVPDTTPPVISDIQATSTIATSNSTDATVTWLTDELADSKVVYSFGTSTVIATSTSEVTSTTLVTNHTLVIPNASTTSELYFYVVSVDASGNTTTSDEQSVILITREEALQEILSDVNFTNTVSELIDAIAGFENNFFTDNGQYWQAVETHDVVPAYDSPTAPTNISFDPNNPSLIGGGSWSEAGILPATMPVSLRINAYVAPESYCPDNQYGYQVIFRTRNAGYDFWKITNPTGCSAVTSYDWQ